MGIEGKMGKDGEYGEGEDTHPSRRAYTRLSPARNHRGVGRKRTLSSRTAGSGGNAEELRQNEASRGESN
jgi:hypothetical protein